MLKGENDNFVNKLDHMSWINAYDVNVRTWMNLDYTANQLNGIWCYAVWPQQCMLLYGLWANLNGSS